MIKMFILIVAITIIGIFLIVKNAEFLGEFFSKYGGIIAIALVVLSLIFLGFWTTLIVVLGIACWRWLDNH